LLTIREEVLLMPRRAKEGGGGSSGGSTAEIPSPYGGSTLVVIGGDGSLENPYRGYCMRQATIDATGFYSLIFGIIPTLTMVIKIKSVKMLLVGATNVTVQPTIVMQAGGTSASYPVGEKKMSQWANDSLEWNDLDMELAATSNQFDGSLWLTSGSPYMYLQFENNVTGFGFRMVVEMEWTT
jgi:hypothetical protein